MSTTPRVTSADEVRQSIRDRALSEKDGIFQRLEAEIQRMKQSGAIMCSTFCTYGTPPFVVEEVLQTYRRAGFICEVTDVRDDRGDDGGRSIVLRLP